MDRLTLMDIGFPRQAIHAEHGKDRLTRFFVRTKQDYKVARLRPEQRLGNKFGDSVNVIQWMSSSDSMSPRAEASLRVVP
ncbi:hypothetical protein CA602_20650 [Paraburkholderia hospita]|nr:hypothetical protein CA602_20650 [Paraburkholderia hospita]